MGAWTRGRGDERGSVLLITVVVMLVFGIMGVAFALLGNLETRIGLNQREGSQALELAEAALEHSRDVARALATGGNFGAAGLVGNASDGSLLLANIALGDGTYSARIDNDCGAALVPAAVTADTGCATHTDGNRRAILTAWATRGAGRTRVRVWIAMSNAWQHVCYNADGTLCTQEPSANSNASVNPSDPDNLYGPATGPLPVPQNLVCGAAVRHTASVTFGATDCVIEPYYDRALDTPCPGCSPARAGCAGHAGMGADLCPDSGMVFYGCSGAGCTGSTLLHGASIKIGSTGGSLFQCAGDHTGGNHPGCPGTGNAGVVVYILGKVTLSNHGEVNGTLVVHGDDAGSTVDVDITGQSGIWTNATCVPVSAGPCGYPMALLIYDPAQSSLPQNTSTHISNSNSEIHGLVYSAGTISFDPINIDGGVVAWTSYFHTASSSATYNQTYGAAAPPPGFSTPTGSQTVAIIRRTWSQCKTYSTTEGSAPTACN